MPFWGFSGKSENYKSKLEHKLCVAKETPEPTFDLADCNLYEVPSGVFSMCRVFLKEVLLLQDNHLSNVQNGGSLKDLSNLTVLNLKNNRFTSLPETIGCLSSLQELNLEGNRLKKLPQAFEKLSCLRQLNLKGNKFCAFPAVLCNVLSLEFLNFFDNDKLKKLPPELCNLSYLKCLELDVEHFVYPPEDVCKGGIEQIMKFLCSESGKEYEPPLSPKESTDSSSSGVSSRRESQWDMPDLSASFLLYQQAKEQRRQELVLMEEALKESDELHAGFAAGASVRRKKLLENFAEEQKRIEDEIVELQNKKEKDKQNLLAVLTDIENHSAELISELMNLTSKTKKFEGMLQVLENDKLENEEMFYVKQEELAQLRKKEVLEAMTEMLQAEERQRLYEIKKINVNEELQNDESESSEKLLSAFHGREKDKQALINEILEEEAYQREAFKVLQLKKDHQHREISSQIKVVEKELLKLTMAEVKKRDLKLNMDVNALAENRFALACLFEELLQAKQQREQELKEYLRQMEESRLEEVSDYWLVQYQKLLDRKPQAIIQAEMSLDGDLKELLREVGAENLLPLFAAKAVTWSQFLEFSLKDLKKIGILDDDICRALIKARDRNLEDAEEWTPPDIPEPSAPPEGEASAPLLSPDADVKLWCQSECVVCLDNASSLVFLPCGHVCCCPACSTDIETCPMCRTLIASKFALTF